MIIKTVDTTATGFKVRLTSASADFVSNGSGTLDLPDLPSTTELVFPIGPGGEIGVSSYDSSSGGAPVNIYNTDGTLTGVRTVNLDDQILRFQGAGNDFFQVEGVQEIDITSDVIAVDVNQLIIVPQFPLDNAEDGVVVQEAGTGQIKRRSAATIGSVTTANLSSTTADVLTNPGTGSGPFNFRSLAVNPLGNQVDVSGNQIRVATLSSVYSTSVTKNGNLTVANNSTATITNWNTVGLTNLYNIGGEFIIGTGVYTASFIPTTTQYKIQFMLNLAYSDSNAAATPVVFTLQLYNQTDAVVVRQCKYYVNHTNTQTYFFGGVVLLTQPKSYIFRIVNPSLAGTQRIYDSSEFTNLMIDRIS